MTAPVKQTDGKRRFGDGTPGPGRPKGVPNKNTTAVKEALNLAFQGIGGVEALIKWGTDNPAQFYPLWVKMLPTEVSGPGGGPIETRQTMDMSGLTDDQLRALASIRLPADAS